MGESDIHDQTTNKLQTTNKKQAIDEVELVAVVSEQVARLEHPVEQEAKREEGWGHGVREQGWELSFFYTEQILLIQFDPKKSA